MATCSHANLISAIGEHKAAFLGYALGQTQQQTSVQKFSCHKVLDFTVGAASRIEGDLSLFQVSLFESLLEREKSFAVEVFQNVEKYHAMLQDEAKKGKSLEDWIDHVVKYGVTDRVPVYDRMSLQMYYNLDVNFTGFMMVFILVVTAFTIVDFTMRQCGCWGA